MNKTLSSMLLGACFMLSATPSMAQFNLKKAIGGASKAVKAATLTDADVANYVKEYIDWMDKHNQVCPENNPYSIRLKKLTQGLNDVEGIPLNFKVYYVTDVNAFACADGSVRVFSSLMDITLLTRILRMLSVQLCSHRHSKMESLPREVRPQRLAIHSSESLEKRC